MGKERFIYNKHSLRYEKLSVPLRQKVLRGLGFMSAVLFSAFIFFSLSYNFFPSPKEAALQREMDQMKDHYLTLNTQLDKMSKVLANVHERDASVHRLMLGMEPIDGEVWNGGIGGHDKYSYLTRYKNTGALLVATQGKTDKLARQIALQSKSLDEIINLAKDKEKMFASIPAIKPIFEGKLKRRISSLSGFGMRLHPIHKVRRMHTGIDFTCSKGTAIQATGAGKVKSVFKKRSGYGIHVIIDHGYGYQTLYAHMSAVDVKVGQKVVRGQLIGKVGSTGTSTAPHLHYEVKFNGKKINPIHFCMDGLSPNEYKELVDASAILNQSMD